jgi:hypothetical protein
MRRWKPGECEGACLVSSDRLTRDAAIQPDAGARYGAARLGVDDTALDDTRPDRRWPVGAIARRRLDSLPVHACSENHRDQRAGEAHPRH